MDSSDRLGLLSALLLLSAAACGWEPPTSPASREAANHFWPPRVGEAYPNLKLLNTSGERVEPSSFRGRVILVEPIGMDCPACNAFAGGSRSGGFQGVRPQAGLPAVDEILRDYAGGVSLADDRFVSVRLLLYAPGRQRAPRLELARRWEAHIGLASSEQHVLLVGEDYLIGPASHAMTPGFQLIDRDFVLRFDASGHRPHHDLWRDLMPAISGLLAEAEAGPAGRPRG
jgi:hypothetical protein